MRKNIFFFLLIASFFSSCKNDTGNKTIERKVSNLSVKTIPVNLSEGYYINQVTGDSIQPLLNLKKDTIITGIPQYIKAEVISKVKNPKHRILEFSSYKTNPVKQNLYKISKKLNTTLVNHDSLKIFNISNVKGSSIIINMDGDTILAGIPILSKGKKVLCKQPKPVAQQKPYYTSNAKYDIQNFGNDQGMSNVYILDICKDFNDNMWFATDINGAIKYDGVNFWTYTVENGIAHNELLTAFTDSKGNVWFGMMGGSVSMFDGNKFTNFSKKEGLTGYNIRSICEDRNGAIWFGSTGGGACRYDGDYITHYSKEQGLPSNNIREMDTDSNGNIWFGTSNGACFFDHSTFTQYSSSNIFLSKQITKVLVAKDGKIWFGSTEGVAVFNGDSITHFTEKDGLTQNDISCLSEGENGEMWIGTNSKGICKYDGDKFIYYNESNGLKSSFVSSVLTISNSCTWISSYSGGVAKFKTTGITQFSNENGLFNSEVSKIRKTKDGNILFGHLTGGVIDKYDGETIKSYGFKIDGREITYISSVGESSDGNIWFNFGFRGLIKFDGEHGILYDNLKGFSNQDILAMLEETATKDMWFAGGGGIYRFDGSNFYNYSALGLVNSKANSIVEDADGNLWISTYRGIHKYDGENFTVYSEKEGLPTNRFTCITQSENGDIWFGSQDGYVVKYDGVNFTSYLKKEVYGGPNIFSIITDKNDCVWVTSDDGLGLLYKSKSEKREGQYVFEKFSQLDGIKELAFYEDAVILDDQNKIWWASEGNVLILDMDHFKLSPKIIKSQLTSLEINEKTLDFRGLKDSSELGFSYSGVASFYNYPLDLTLDHNNNHLTFYFSGVDWMAPHKIKYSFRMKTLGDNWTLPSKESKADYRNLPYGNHTFEVKSIGESGLWGDTLVYSFEISPPWWLTLWAKIAYFILAILFLFLIVRWRTNILKLKQIELENEISNATTEIRSQKNVIELAHEQITDSILYSKKIQTSLLPSKSYLESQFKQIFILYEPKDIVSGDFYWFKKFKNYSIIACADSTGHGVPGGFMSTLGSLLLDKIVDNEGLAPSDILSQLSNELIRVLRQEDEESIQDGMDMSICLIDRENGLIHFAGARNGLVVTRNNEATIYKADLLPVGGYYTKKGKAIERKFTTQKIALEKDSWVVMFTDGFIEQLGGNNGHPMTSIQFKQCLDDALQNSKNENIVEYLRLSLLEWQRGNIRNDDVCIIGFKV